MKIALVGYSRSGKNTVADMLVEKLGLTKKLAFENDLLRLSKTVSRYRGHKHIILTDLRQKNEEKWARENGFTLIEVWSPIGFRIQRTDDDSFVAVTKLEENLHDIKCDYTIKNIGSLEELDMRVDGLVTLLKMLKEAKENEESTNRGNETSHQHHGKTRKGNKKYKNRRY